MWCRAAEVTVLEIHTIAPNTAVSAETLSTSALTGSTTLPVNRNSRTNVVAAITPIASGSRSVMPAGLSRLICATPSGSHGSTFKDGCWPYLATRSRSSSNSQASSTASTCSRTVRKALAFLESC